MTCPKWCKTRWPATKTSIYLLSWLKPRKARWFCIRTWFEKRFQELPHAEMTINQSAAHIIFKSLPYHCDILWSNGHHIILNSSTYHHHHHQISDLFAFQRIQKNQHLFRVATTKTTASFFARRAGKLLTPPTSLTDPAASPMRPPSRGWDWLAIAKKICKFVAVLCILIEWESMVI